MAITKRSDKGSALTYNEMDDNFDAIAPRTSETGAIEIPAGPTADRPSSASAGMFRYNTSLNSFEGYSSGAWGSVGSGGVGGGDVNQNAWSEIAVSGQATVSADTATDLITLIAGTNMSITTDAGADSITFNATFNQDFAYSSLTGAPSIPGDLTDLGITDGSSGQVLSTDGSGNFTFVNQTGGGTQGVQGITGLQGPLGTTLQGTQGLIGPSGADGNDGADGDPGIQGPAGSMQGLQGVQGTDGTDGAQGITGSSIQGIQGPAAEMQGTQGPEGPEGDFGPQGIQGIQGGGGQGVQGLQGGRGFDGQPGFQGIQGGGGQGVQGIQGDTGPAGFGAQGHQGVQGLIGPGGTGPQGIQGIQGSQSVQGPQGVDGGDGPDGPQGIQGPAGSVQGVQGVTGGSGIQGAQGIQGESFQGTTGQDGIQGSQGVQGDLGVQGIQGTVGTSGLQGAQGVQGVQGGLGEQGLQGFQGTEAQGIQGLTGGEGAAGPQGVQGTEAQGVQGVQGTTLQGLQGPEGFGVQGYQGTQAVQGIQGTKGIQGPSDGPQGIQGPVGPVGPSDGPQGIAGADGSDGFDGAQGIQGLQGPFGPDGVQGSFGLQGVQGAAGSVQGVQGPSGTTGNLNNVVEDTTPQLGGNLDARNNIITNVNYIQTGQVTSGSGNLTINPASGNSLEIGHPSVTPKVLIQASAAKSLADVANNEVMIAGTVKLNDLTFPSADGTNGQVLTTDGAGTLSFANASSGISNVVEDTTPQLGGNLDLNDFNIVGTNASDISLSGNGTLSVGTALVANTSQVSLDASGGGTVSINNIVYPEATGTTGQVLTFDSASNSAVWDDVSGSTNLVDDTTPQLGGNLDVTNRTLFTLSNGDMTFFPNGSGDIRFSTTMSSSTTGGMVAFKKNLPNNVAASNLGSHGLYVHTDSTLSGTYASIGLHPGTDTSPSTNSLSWIRSTRNSNSTATVEIAAASDSGNGDYNKLTITGSTGVVGLPGPLQLPSYTDTELGSLSGSAGMLVWNSTQGALRVHNGTGWVAV
jgi:hypothetical protein